MRFPLLVAIILLFLNAALDFYLYLAIKCYCKRRIWSKIQAWSALALTIFLLVLFLMPKRDGADGTLTFVMWGLFVYLSVYIPKYIYFLFDVGSRIPRLWHKNQSMFTLKIGLGVAILVFILMWWGALINRTRINVNEVEVVIADLPKEFDGYKIVQISDIHIGTYGNDTSFMHKMVEKINSLNPDLVVFTGDIVNRKSSELEPFVSTLSHIRATDGVYSVLGNHDYGDYYDWASPGHKLRNMEHLKSMQAQMGWQMLNDSSVTIHRNGDELVLIGVENIGDPPFPSYGNLENAYSNISDDKVKILLSHNPAHWEKDIKNKKNANIALTLSGHTHAMQIELFGLSPAAWRYHNWAGMYSDDLGHQNYVNIGIGTVGFPARIGATPEITLFTLKPKK